MGSRRRGGVGYQEARPSSIVGAADVLAAEFGMGMDSVIEDGEETREFAEFACQTEPVEQIPPPPPPPIVITPEMADSSIQTDPEPEPEVKSVEPVPIPIPVVERADAGLQTEPEPVPLLVSVSMSTDPEPEPVPAVVRTFTDSSSETVPIAVPLSSEMSVQTEVEGKDSHEEEDVSVRDAHELTMRPATPIKTTSEAQTQTTPHQGFILHQHRYSSRIC